MSRFIRADGVAQDAFDWGTIGWRLGPQDGAEMVVIDVVIEPGAGHDFHRHPTQQETIIVLRGRIVQYLEQEPSVLEVGDSVFIDRGVVHASFNDADEPAHLQIVLAPALPEGTGYVAEDVFTEEPWASLRG
jgi:quercetin dioxygenase-like cupin family protein